MCLTVEPCKHYSSDLASTDNWYRDKSCDAQGFDDFALSVSTLVGLLNTLEGSSRVELMCGSLFIDCSSSYHPLIKIVLLGTVYVQRYSPEWD